MKMNHSEGMADKESPEYPKLVWVDPDADDRPDDLGQDEPPPMAPGFMAYSNAWYGREDFDRSVIKLEWLARWLDLRCEDRNNHSFTKVHQTLAIYLYHALGREKATELMWGIAGKGGMDAMCGWHPGEQFNTSGLAYPEHLKRGHWNYDWKLPD